MCVDMCLDMCIYMCIYMCIVCSRVWTIVYIAALVHRAAGGIPQWSRHNAAYHQRAWQFHIQQDFQCELGWAEGRGAEPALVVVALG